MLYDLVILDGADMGLLKQVREFIDEWQSDSSAIEVQTSGSTGSPKRILLEKTRIRASALSTGSYFGFKEGEVALLNLSPDYIAGKLLIVRAIEHGMTLMVAPLKTNPLIHISSHPIDFAAFVPLQIAAILEDDQSRLVLNGIRNVIIGGAPLHPNLENQLTAMRGNFFASFGMTETITHFALRKLGTPIYKCLAGFQVSADDKSCLVIHPNEIVKELVFTSDVIDFIDKQTFKWSGRYDNVINSGGIKIHPEKTEKMISHLLPNNRYYITSKQDRALGEIVVLVIEGEFNEGDILNDAKESLPKYHAPKEIILQARLEETPTQKVVRKKF